MTDRRTPAQWVEYLAQEQQAITLTEFMAGCLSRMLAAQIETANASRHTESMVGTLDEFLDGSTPEYRQVAAKRTNALRGAG